MVNKLFIFSAIVACVLNLSLWSETMPSSVHGDQWMKDYAEYIANKPFNQVIMPGSHDSATYKLETEVGRSQDVPTNLNIAKSLIGPVIRKWSKAQDRTITKQLHDGIRYFDLRVIYRPEKKEFYTVHGVFGPSLNDILSQFTEYLPKYPTEIVVIQIGDLNYMGSNDHEREENHLKVIDKLRKAFGDKLVGQNEGLGPSSLVKDLWAKGKQVFLIYKDNNLAERFNDMMWSRKAINSYWTDSQSVGDLKKRLDANLDGRVISGGATKNFRAIPFDNDNHFFVVQSQLTATGSIIAKGLIPLVKPSSLEDMADSVREKLPRWLNDWKDRNPNIIMFDFTDANMAWRIYNLNKR